MSEITTAVTAEPVEQACDHQDSSRLRYEEKRHARMVEQAAKVLQGGSPAADSSHFRDQWAPAQASAYEGLREADLVNPYYNFNTFTSHFYNPTCRCNYLGEKEPTANTEACRFFRLSLAHRYYPDRPIDRKYPVNGAPTGYYIGIALHYLTDLGQPMHAANVINVPLVDWRHAGFEATLETHLNEFHAPIPGDESFLDTHVLMKARSLEELIGQLAWKSYDVWVQYLEEIFKHMPLNGDPWPLDPIRPAVEKILPEAERCAAAFLLLWTRGYDSIINRLYQRFFNRVPDKNGASHYRDCLINQGYTVRSLVFDLGHSQEYFKDKVLPRDPAGRRKLLYQDFLNRGEDAHATPSVDEMRDITLEKWKSFLEVKVNSPEYLERFGDNVIPGYKGLSDLVDPMS